MTEAHVGTYQCKIKNAVGEAVSGTVSVQLQDSPPNVIGQTKSMQTHVGHSVTLEAVFAGNPEPELQWQFNNTDLPSETNATLTIPAMTYETDGTYVCVATNRAGSVQTDPILLTLADQAPSIQTQSSNQRVAPGG